MRVMTLKFLSGTLVAATIFFLMLIPLAHAITITDATLRSRGRRRPRRPTSSGKRPRSRMNHLEALMANRRSLLLAASLLLIGYTYESGHALVTTIEPCFDPASLCTLSRTQLDDGSELIRIDKPAVIRRDTVYDKIVFQPGDEITFSANGCVQTGGFGATWKRYVRPQGSGSGDKYFGTVSVPGVFAEIAFRDLFPEGSMTSSPIIIPTTTFPAVLHLGYTDDDYLDNGYNDHDDGTGGQCSFAHGNDGGPAHVEIAIRPGTAPPPTDLDWDLIPNLRAGEPFERDDNGLFLNPRWGWQTPSRLAPDFNSDQTTQITSHDNALLCILGGVDPGHINWMAVTATGLVFWDEHSTGAKGDDDYNIKILTRQVPDTIYRAGVTQSNRGTAGEPTHMIKGEFDSDETVDYSEFDNIPWWKDFHDAVDRGDGFFNDGGASARAMIDGHQAVMVGLMGLDLGHPPPASEIHPVHALAIRIAKKPNPQDDGWAFFVRNWGNEGFCSSNQHYLETQTFTFRLQRPSPCDGVLATAVATPGRSIVQSHNVQTKLTVASIAEQDVSVTVQLAEPTAESFVVGEIHLVWPDTGIRCEEVSNVTVAPEEQEEEGDPEDQIRQAFDRLSPTQQALAQSLVSVLQTPRPKGLTFEVPVEFVSTPPVIPDHMPGVSTGPAPRKLARSIAKLQSLCVAAGGNVEVNGASLCSTLPPKAFCQNRTVPTDPGVCTAANISINNGSFDPGGGPITLAQSPAGPYSLGATLVTLTATESDNLFDSCQATVTVVDTTPPNIANVTASPNSLWPPNHKLVPVIVTASASDTCSTTTVCKITSVSSNEPVNGTGDGDTAPDWVITGDLTVNLRAERAGTGSGRVYTITVQCTDASGNSSTKTVAVTVPHDQRKK